MKKITYLLLVLFCGKIHAQDKLESLKIMWPEEYKWKKESGFKSGSVYMTNFLLENETVDNWTIRCSMWYVEDVKTIDIAKTMHLTFEQVKGRFDNAIFTEIERDDKAQHPWVLFKVESASLSINNNTDAELWYIVQGESSIYTNVLRLNEKKLNDEFVKKWSEIFKKSELVYN
jgi:hypothetical protein